MTTANSTKQKTKRPLTIYGCDTDQKEECNYRYLAKVYFYRTVIAIISGSVTVSAGIIWYTAIWKTNQENTIQTLRTESEQHDLRIKNIEHTIKSDLDSLKAWNRPK